MMARSFMQRRGKSRGIGDHGVVIGTQPPWNASGTRTKVVMI